MNISEVIDNSKLVLTECAISERLRRMDGVSLHPQLFNTPLVDDEFGRQQMTAIYRQYREAALSAQLPIILCAPTWRVNKPRLAEAGFPETLLDGAVAYMQHLQRSWQNPCSPLFIGGLVGPKNDCYTPSQALQEIPSYQFHSWQIDKLASLRVDCIIAQTIPAVPEAIGIARAASDADIAAIISFVIDRAGNILDGTPLAEAIDYIDSRVTKTPIGYMVNCVYPTFIQAEKQPEKLFSRLIGIQANSSSMDHSELDGSDILHQDDLGHWGENMLKLNHAYGVKILGGCCGTDETYLQYIIDNKN